MSPARWALGLAVGAALACSAAPGVGEDPREPGAGGDGRGAGAGGENPTGGTLDQGTGGAGDPATGAGTGGLVDDPKTCVWEGPPAADVSTLPNCGPKASCVPSALVPPEAKTLLASCDGGGACVPNVFIEKNGKFVLPSCRSLYGAEGRCLTTAIPLVKSAGDFIPQDKCEAGEKCLPCFNPFDGTDTSLCKQSCDTGPAEAAKLAPKCCPLQGKDRGVCVPKALVPQGAAANLVEEGACVNAQPGAYVCVPQEVAQVSTAPKKCSASILLLGRYDGVCLSDCFAQSFLTGLIGRGDCADPATKCAPCTNPLDGTPTGLPGCAGAAPLPGTGGDAGAPADGGP